MTESRAQAMEAVKVSPSHGESSLWKAPRGLQSMKARGVDAPRRCLDLIDAEIRAGREGSAK